MKTWSLPTPSRSPSSSATPKPKTRGDDVDGRDACRKIAILASLACGHAVYPDNIPTRGIRAITVADIQAAERLDCAVKLIAWYRELPGGGVAAGVEPMLIPHENQLAGVDDVFNAVLMRGDMLGDVVFYGKGAGKLPTASAVVADVIDALKEGAHIHDSLFWLPAEKQEGQLADPGCYAWYLRAAGVRLAVLAELAGAGEPLAENRAGRGLPGPFGHGRTDAGALRKDPPAGRRARAAAQAAGRLTPHRGNAYNGNSHRTGHQRQRWRRV